jgi:hypothetical protein
MFYAGRVNMSIAIPGIMEESGYSAILRGCRMDRTLKEGRFA